MNRIRLHPFSLTALVLLVLTAAGLAHHTSSAQETNTSRILAGDPALIEIANYKQWKRVNEISLPVPGALVSGTFYIIGETGI